MMMTNAAELPKHSGSCFPGLHPTAKLLIAILIGIQASFCWMAKERSLAGNVDLRAFYAAGIMVRQGRAAQLYDPYCITQIQHLLFGDRGRTLPFLYPPIAALPFVALSLLPYPAAFTILFVVNLGLLYGSAWLLGNTESNVGLSPIHLFGLFLSFFPTSIALMQGQVSCALLVVFALSHVLSEGGCRFVAGMCLSVALVKFQLVLPVVILLILWRRWRVVCGFLLGSAFVVAGSLSLTGLQGAKGYLACIRGLGTSMLRDPASAHMRFGMQTPGEPNLHGLIVTLVGVNRTGTLLLLGSSIFVMVWAARFCRTLASAVPAAMLVSYHMQPYDLLFLLLPIVVSMQGTAIKLPLAQGVKARVLIASILLLTAPLAPLLLVWAKTTWFVLAILGILFACGHTWAAKTPACGDPGDVTGRGASQQGGIAFGSALICGSVTTMLARMNCSAVR